MEKKATCLILIVSCILIICITSCKQNSSKKEDVLTKTNIPKVDNGFKITGKTNVNAHKIYLLNQDFKKIDSITIIKNEFTFQGKIQKPEIFYLQIENNSKKHLVILENTEYHMLLNDDLAMVIGGNLNDLFFKYQHKKRQYLKNTQKYYDEYKSKNLALDSYLQILDSITTIEKKNFVDFLLIHKDDILSSIVLEQQKLSSKEVNHLKKIPSLSSNKELLVKLEQLEKSLKNEEINNEILRRKPAPLFSGINLDGTKSSLKNLLQGKKVFLIDFWASWCPPCREASPKIIKLYKKYSTKGFDVLTVSEDRSVAEWKNGIYVDEIESWHHIYDDYNRISSMYNVTSLPHMILIDEKGKIIDPKISFEKLELELAKIFNE